jgi:hypothetical protein
MTFAFLSVFDDDLFGGLESYFLSTKRKPAATGGNSLQATRSLIPTTQ